MPCGATFNSFSSLSEIVRILQLHCDSMEYNPIKKEIKAAEEITPESVRLEELVVVFVTIEEGDNSTTAQRAVLEMQKFMDVIGCKKILLYPYAHLSSDLAPPGQALAMMHEIERLCRDMQVSRAPFGWTKSYSIKVKGHPLAENSKIIRDEEPQSSHALKSESEIRSLWYIMSPDGTMKKISEYDFAKSQNLEVLAKYEIAKKRSADEPPPHVSLMKKMAIADYEPASDSGNMRFYPNGRLIKSLIEEYVTSRVREYGGYEVETPIMYDSHHPSMESYFNRFPARQYSIDSEGKSLFLRFAACFGQFLMANDLQMSYRNMPYRLYELTRYSFRREQSGELVGLRRLRAFTMPDCHAFCKDMPQAILELKNRFHLSKDVLRNMEISDNDYEMAVRFTRGFYDKHRNTIEELVKEHGRPVLVEMWEEKFFYFVLKWEFNYVDGLGKASALSTDQIDVENGSRYGITFTDEKNEPQHPIILHNSPSGAIERIIYVLLEKAAADSKMGKKPHLPFWLTPTHVRIIPITEDFMDYAYKLEHELSGHNVRTDIDDRSDSLGKKIRHAEKDWIRHIIVVGKKEAESDILSVRNRETGTTSDMKLDELLSVLEVDLKGKPSARLNMPVLLSRRPQIMV